jgi:hypothetical protein
LRIGAGLLARCLQSAAKGCAKFRRWIARKAILVSEVKIGKMKEQHSPYLPRRSAFGVTVSQANW